MRRPSRPPPPRRTGLAKLRPWILPAVAIVLGIALFRGGFDADALASDLRGGRIDAALDRLAAAQPSELFVELRDVAWWPADRRDAALSDLAALRDEDQDAFLESADLPTFVAPLGRWRDAPTAIRLRDPTDRPLQFQLTHSELGLVAASTTLPTGTTEWPPGATLLPGATYTLTLRETDEAPLLAFAGFEMLKGSEATGVGIAMATARDLAGDPDGGQLLAGLVALHYGLTDEALRRFESLAGRIAYEPVVDELVAITLAAQGLDRSALERVER